MKQACLWLAVVALVTAVVAGVAAVSHADGGDTATDLGDPSELPAGSQTLEPTPVSLSGFWMILMAMAFQFAL